MYTLDLFSGRDKLSYSSDLNDSGLTLDVALPGFLKEEVSLALEGNRLTLKAKTDRKLPKALARTVVETFYLNIVPDAEPTAKLENGILTVFLKNARATKNIEIS